MARKGGRKESELDVPPVSFLRVITSRTFLRSSLFCAIERERSYLSIHIFEKGKKRARELTFLISFAR